jgi:hypothetical protein
MVTGKMKVKMLVALLIAGSLGLQAGAQTNANPIFTTNYVTAVPWYREVNGQLYNTTRSALWKTLAGDILKVSTNEIVLSTFQINPNYGVETPSGQLDYYYVGGVDGAPPTFGKKLYGKKVIICDCPASDSHLALAVGETVQIRAMYIGTTNHDGDMLELWDHGTPHVVIVVTTNYARAFKTEKGSQ